MIITLGGEPGSGKSTVARMLAQRLGYRFYSTGDLRGEIAVRHGLTIDELNEIGRHEIWPHKECDDRTVEIGRTQDDIVIDSWLAWHFIPHSKKILLTVDPRASAERVFANQRPDEKHQDSIEGVQQMLQDRYQVMASSFRKWYGIDISDRDNYDIVIDTTRLSPEEVVERILERMN